MNCGILLHKSLQRSAKLQFPGCENDAENIEAASAAILERKRNLAQKSLHMEAETFTNFGTVKRLDYDFKIVLVFDHRFWDNSGLRKLKKIVKLVFELMTNEEFRGVRRRSMATLIYRVGHMSLNIVLRVKNQK